MTRCALVLALCFASLAAAAPPGGPHELVILHINDLHGYGMPREYLGADLPPAYLHHQNGGLFSAATRVRQIREEIFAQDPEARAEFERTGHDPILFLEGGDLWSGTLDDAASHGENVVELLLSPALDVDVSVPGNHAWDFGQKRWEELTRKMEGHHPVLCANLAHAGAKAIPFLKPWTVLEVRGVRVGVVGLLTPTALQETLPENAKGLEVSDVVDALKKALAEMRALPEAQRPELTVALCHVAFDRPISHRGIFQAGVKVLDAMDDGARPGDDAHPEWNVDLVVDGHSHLDLEKQVDSNTWLVQADHYGLKLGEIRVPWDPVHRRMAGPPKMKRHLLMVEDLPMDPAMLAQHRERVDKARATNDEKLVDAQAGLALPCVPRAQLDRLDSPSGDLLMRALMDGSAKRGARPEVALINQSGVREGIYASKDGTITAGAAHAVCPFANPVESCELTARDLVVLLGRQGIQQSSRMSWAGLEVTALQEGRKPGASSHRKLAAAWLVGADGSRVNVMEPASAQRRVRVVAPSFLMSRELAPYAAAGTRKKVGATDDQMLREYLLGLAKDADGGRVTAEGAARLIGTPCTLQIEE